MKFNRLEAIEDTGRRTKSSGNKIWLFKCDCGNKKEIALTQVKNGYTKSCGCLQREKVTKHGSFSGKGKKTTSTYRSWMAMKTRCLNKNSKDYKYYGGRGIKICERWKKFENFLEDKGERPKGMTLDRIDNNGDYTPENTRWTTSTKQQNNQRYNKGNSKLNKSQVIEIKKLLKNTKMTLQEIGDKFGVTKYTISSIKRNKNWSQV